MNRNVFNIRGLTDAEVAASRQQHGSNTLTRKKEHAFLKDIIGLVKEPMVLLLLVASTVYFITGNTDDGIFLSVAILLVSAISLFQESRSRNALDKLKTFTQPKSTVIRNGLVEEINSDNLVVGDFIMVEEGALVTADGEIVHSNDFSVNESILTGESFSVSKDKDTTDNRVFSGTTVASGLAIARVTAIGNETRIGKIGESLQNIAKEKTPLELQINNFVRKMVIAGVAVFAVVWILNFLRSRNVLDSLLQSLTLAMSILPEEIPVAFVTFMALGSWRLMKSGVVVKQMKTVETLGSATVICTDKTGTITENKMTLAKLYVPSTGVVTDANNLTSDDQRNLIRLAMWASEPIPFDPMEQALHAAYAKLGTDERPDFRMIHEYPLGGKPPMMTHVFENTNGVRVVAAKGAPEAMVNVSNLSDHEKKKVEQAWTAMASEGYRVLGVGEAQFAGNAFPATQQELPFVFKGLVAFYDPPKQNIASVLQDFYAAGINVKIVTGDNAATTAAIARQIGFCGADRTISGDVLMQLFDDELQRAVTEKQVFTRMFPDAKLKIINALKRNGEIVAMTGDGVNDGPALQAAHIGIGMGKKGTEIAKQAASLILLDDDLSKMVNAVAMGRRIYTNLKKAIQYIISIHIPIILTVFVPLALGWIYPNIFSPIHVIFLELIMGPTCSIMFENEPIEENTMQQKPRPFTNTFFNPRELSTSIVQGLVITIGTLTAYQFAVAAGYNEDTTRTMVFVTLITANIFLTLVNRSFFFSMLTTLRYKNALVPLIVGFTVVITLLLLYVKPMTDFFHFETLNAQALLTSVAIGFVSVVWYEVVKYFKRASANDLVEQPA